MDKATAAKKRQYRALLAAEGVATRHGHRVWGVPRTNLGVDRWPAGRLDALFITWRGASQAAYLAALADAVERTKDKADVRRVANTLRGLKLRSVFHFPRRHPDRAAIIFQALACRKLSLISTPPQGVSALASRLEGIVGTFFDPVTGMIAATAGGTTIPCMLNAAAALLLSWSGRENDGVEIIKWLCANAVDENGLIRDSVIVDPSGLLAGPGTLPATQAFTLAASVAAIEAIRRRHNLLPSQSPDPLVVGSETVQTLDHLTKIVKDLTAAVSKHLTTSLGVLLPGQTGEGVTRSRLAAEDIGPGFLVRALADVAVRLPTDSDTALVAAASAARIVQASADAVWRGRLEITGLPIFSADWRADAHLPVAMMGDDSSRVPERRLAVQLAAWFALEADAILDRAGR